MKVRDEAIEKFDMIAAGKMNSAPAKNLHEKLDALSEDQLETIRNVVVSSIDDVVVFTEQCPEEILRHTIQFIPVTIAETRNQYLDIFMIPICFSSYLL